MSWRTRKPGDDYGVEYTAWCHRDHISPDCLAVKKDKEAAIRVCRQYQHVGPTYVEEKVTRVVYAAKKTAVCDE